MDVLYFLRLRTNFIRFFYDEGLKPFSEVKRRIERELPPYDNPPYSENGEPAFLDTWMNAGTAAQIVGLSCVSLVSDSLKLYFETLQERAIGFSIAKENERDLFRKGFVSAYRSVLGHILETDWSDCPADFDVIEQIVLTRNRGQHGEDLVSFHATHDGKTMKKHPRPIFANEEECEAWAASGRNERSFLTPSIEITRDNLFAALLEVEKLAEWIDGRMEKAHEWRMRGRKA